MTSTADCVELLNKTSMHENLLNHVSKNAKWKRVSKFKTHDNVTRRYFFLENSPIIAIVDELETGLDANIRFVAGFEEHYLQDRRPNDEYLEDGEVGEFAADEWRMIRDTKQTYKGNEFKFAIMDHEMNSGLFPEDEKCLGIAISPEIMGDGWYDQHCGDAVDGLLDSVFGKGNVSEACESSFIIYTEMSEDEVREKLVNIGMKDDGTV